MCLYTRIYVCIYVIVFFLIIKGVNWFEGRCLRFESIFRGFLVVGFGGSFGGRGYSGVFVVALAFFVFTGFIR